MKLKLKPLSNRIIVQRLEAESRTPGGVLLPDMAKEKPRRGKIVAVGPGKSLDDGGVTRMTVEKGQTVLFAAYAGNEVEVDGKQYLVMTEDDILAVVEE